jgi:hypothetical protein
MREPTQLGFELQEAYEVMRALGTLAHNIEMAARFEYAYTMGAQWGYQWATREPFYPTAWASGCGKPAFVLLTVVHQHEAKR